MPIRCQHLLICLLRYDVQAEYVPGQDMIGADTLSSTLLLSVYLCLCYEVHYIAGRYQGFVCGLGYPRDPSHHYLGQRPAVCQHRVSSVCRSASSSNAPAAAISHKVMAKQSVQSESLSASWIRTNSWTMHCWYTVRCRSRTDSPPLNFYSDGAYEWACPVRMTLSPQLGLTSTPSRYRRHSRKRNKVQPSTRPSRATAPTS